ncbi:MAG: Cerebroside-sulfatase [Planctomycetaceae bacterium]|jgi:arylsulfatase A-like enzyme|nr:Cerebroside-sulfatase [Planctomycetaceae bacterium]MDP7277566.1 arylsulfatase [Planctomycetaceae bacterium]
MTFFRPLPVWILLLAVINPSFVEAASRPNIVIIMADDMGYGDVQALNPESRIPTPHLNRLAREGLRFTDAHTPSAVCTPTRYGLLTGRYCWRSRLKRGVLNGYGTPLIEPDRPTFASFLKSHGYRTGIVGKWHLGLDFTRLPASKTEKPAKDKKAQPKRSGRSASPALDFTRPILDGPNRRGFEDSLIIPASLDFPPYVYIRNTRITESRTVTQPAIKFPGFLRRGPRGKDLVMVECLDYLKQQANQFLQQRARDPETPFLLYFPLTAPHKPVLPHPRFRGKTKLGPYGDFIAQVDDTIGSVLDTLDRTGMADSTLLICTSDNGSFMRRYDNAGARDHVDDPSIQGFRKDRHRSNANFRGTKADIWEAGHRVPFFVRWPGTVKPGTRTAATICLTDVFATVAEVIGRPLPKDGAPDSYSFLGVLAGTDKKYQRPPVIHHSAAGMFAIRDGRWKLVLGNGSGGRQAPRGRPFAKPFFLADLAADPSETTNLAEKNPDVAIRLESAARKIRLRPLPR